MATKNSGWLCTHSASITSSNNTSVTITVTCYWQNNGWNYDINDVSAWVYCDGQAKQVMSSNWVHATSSNSQKVNLGSATFTISKSTSTKSISCYGKITSNSSYVSGTKTSTASSVSVPAKPSYKISYNANGGSGAPSSQTKWYGTNITLSSTKPTRTGYSFKGWGTSSTDTTVDYNPGATYSSNAAIALYAIWTANTYTVSYNANGGSGAPSSQTKTYGKTLTLSSTKPTRTNYNFKGWGTSSSSTTASYQPGGSYTANSKITLYAIWELAYIEPRIFNVSIMRCDSNENILDTGLNALVSFNWQCDKTISSIKIEWKLSSSPTWSNSDTVSASGTSGQVSKKVGSDDLNVESTYDFRITISDSNGSSDILRTLNSTKFLIDFLKGENGGVAFGKTAELENTAEFAFDAKFNNPVSGNVMGLNKLPEIPANSDLNDYMETGSYAVYRNDNASTIANIPVARAGRLEVSSSTGEGIRSEQWSYLRQKYIPYNIENATWERDITRSSDNVWTYGDWIRTSLSKSVYKYVYNEQKILWGADLSSGMYMTEGHTINLSEPVSEQRHGIVLVFSCYNGTSDTNYNWQSFFVPKYLIGGVTSGHMFTLNRGKFTYIGTKYLYLKDTSITGHADNILTGTNNGITYANNKFVLRYVFGV